MGQLNVLLEDRSWWSADRRGDAEREFAPQIVSAFFDGIEAGRVDTAQLRDARIPLPGKDDGYARVLLVGTTGSGKTTLLRHLIGSSHENDRFPSTSTAKTTISDTEITAEGPFAAAVTFMSEFEVRAHIDECIEAACAATEVAGCESGRGAADASRAALSSVLSAWRVGQRFEADDEDFSFDTVVPAAGVPEEEDSVTNAERRSNSERLETYVSRVRSLASEINKQNAIDLWASFRTAISRQQGREQTYSDRLFDSEEFARLALDIRDEGSKAGSICWMRDRLNVAQPAGRSSGRSRARTGTRRQVRWFSSSHFRQFGRLLTPLVDGIRVRGPFRPAPKSFTSRISSSLLDGQGLGHTAESVSSVSTRVTKRFAEVDLIVLVDSSQQPMQAAPLALLRAAGSAGYADKIALAFSHFDQVKGDNLQTTGQKRAHVMASVGNAVAGLRQLLGAPVAAALERRLEEARLRVRCARP